MRLEDLTIALRPRQPWEAVDLGCALVRRDYGRLLGLWGITVAPLWLILGASLWRHPGVFFWVAWWLKPLYDRVPLFFISSAAFGVRPSIGATLRAWPRLWTRFLLSALLFRRLSFIRAFSLPVWMLEGQRGKAVRQRVKSLATDGSTPAVHATMAFSLLELAIGGGLFMLTMKVVPEAGMPEFSELFEANFEAFFTNGLLWYLNLVYLAAVTLAEPFYVGAGFGLYLNSRTRLEGWDIELTFRRLAARLRAAAGAATLAFVLLASLLAGPVHAAPYSGRVSDAPRHATGPKGAAAGGVNDAAKDTIKEILAKPEFKVHKRKQYIRVPDKKKPQDSKDTPWNMSLMAFLFRIFGYACAAVIVGLLVWLIIRNRHLLFGLRVHLPKKGTAPPKGPRIVMGLDIARESLPADLLTAARAAWQSGHAREALSLLYRGALSRLSEQRRLPIRDSDTEDDCLAHVAKSGEAGVTDYFGQLTRLWVRAAYAGIEAGADEFENLCRGWPFDHHAAKQRPAAHAQTILLGLTLAGLPLVLASCGGKTEEIEIETGYKGAARSNPFLAAQQLLKEYGHNAKRLTHLKELPAASGSVLVLSGESGLPEARSRQLLEWVSSGHHLVYAVAGCRPYSDWSSFGGGNGYAYFGNDEREDPLLTALKVTATDRRPKYKGTPAKEKPKDKDKDKPSDETQAPAAPVPETPDKNKDQEEEKEEDEDDKITAPEKVPTHKNEITWLGKTYQVEFPDFVTFKVDRDLSRNEYRAGTPDQASVLSLKYGSGRVTLLSHARPLRNRYLGDQDHAQWLLAMVGKSATEVDFVLTIETNIWRMLWQKGWMPIIVLGLLVLAWFWRYLPRFGPVREIELHETKHFSHHIRALGHFFHGLRRDDLLLNAAANAVRSRAYRRFPHLKSQGEEALVPILAQSSGLTEERVQHLLTPAVPKQPYHLVRLLQDLQLMRKSLG